MQDYYIKKENVEKLKKLNAPTKTNVQELLSLLKDDIELANIFYKDNNNTNWFDLLSEEGQFKELPPVIKEGESTIYYRWAQGDYLVTVAGQRPGEVLEIIKDIETKNIRVMFPCLKALEAMPVEVAAEGMELVQEFLGEKDIYNDWFYVGEPAAKLMVKFAEGGKYDEAFAIAEKLLEVKIKENKAFGANWYNLEGRFDEYHYEELLSQYFRILWKKENQGIRAAQALIELLCKQIDKEQERVNKRKDPKKVQKAFEKVFGDQEEKPFEVTEHSYIIIPDVGKIDEQRHSIARAIVEEICRIGEHLMKTDEAGAEEFIKILDAKEKVIFRRIKWNTLRFAQGKTRKQEIEGILVDGDHYDNPWVGEEFKTLLNEKWEEISGPIRQRYITWAEGRTIEDEEDFRKWFKDTRGTDAQLEDIEAYQHYYKAMALYCVKDKPEVQEKYKEHLEKSQRSEDEIKPHVLGKVETCWSGSPEYSPLKIEEMGKKTAKEVIETILEYDRQHTDEDEEQEQNKRFWKKGDEKEALANAFKQDVINRAGDYIGVEANLVVGMSRRFLRNYFYGIDEVLNTQKLENPDWGKILEVMQKFVSAKVMLEDYREVSTTIPRVLEEDVPNVVET